MAGSQRARARARLQLLLLLRSVSALVVAFFYRPAAARLTADGPGALSHLRPVVGAVVGANIRAPIGDIRVIVVVVIVVVVFLAHRLALGSLTRPRRRRLRRATTALAAIRLPHALAALGFAIGAAAGACRRVSGSALVASLTIIVTVTPTPQLLRTGHVLL